MNSKTKGVIRFLFSEVGLTLFVIGYIVGGGFLFRAIELTGEQEQRNKTDQHAQKVEEALEQLKADLKRMNVEFYNIKNQTAVVDFYKEQLNVYQKTVIEARKEGYKGEPYDPNEEKQYGWDAVSAILFTASILTTIGYGHVYPETKLGQLAVILYAVLAVPVMSMFLMKIGAGVASFVEMIYYKGCCHVFTKRRIKKHEEQNQDGGTDQPPRPRSAWSASETDPDYWEGEEEEGVDANNEHGIPKYLIVLIVFIYLMLGTVFFHAIEGDWTLVQSLYCAFVTLSTIGFGDLVPGKNGLNDWKNKLRLCLVCIYVVVGLAIVAMGINLALSNLAKEAERMRHLMEQEDERKKSQAAKGDADSPYEGVSRHSSFGAGGTGVDGRPLTAGSLHASLYSRRKSEWQKAGDVPAIA